MKRYVATVVCAIALGYVAAELVVRPGDWQYVAAHVMIATSMVLLLYTGRPR